MTIDQEIRKYPFSEAPGIDIDPVYGLLRSTEPLARVQLPYGEVSWLATRYEDVKTVLTDPRFSRAAAQGKDQPRTREEMTYEGIIGLDPPDHTRLRKLAGKALTARRVNEMREGAQRIANEYVDEMIAKGSPGDLVELFALPYPITVICELLGVPFEDRAQFRIWTEGLTSTSEQLMVYAEQLFGYMGKLVAQRREQPTDDLLGALVKARDEGDRLTEQELLSIAGVGLLLTGVETVSTHIPNFVYALLTNPELMAQLRADRSLVPAAVEELLRMIPLNPAAMFPRYAVEDIELSGITVRAGEPVLVSLPGANRDPEIFDNPETFDFTREQNPHVAFGHGPHHCLGAQLARMELQVALHTVLDRFPELSLADGDAGVSWKSGQLVRGPNKLLVAW
ncbi:MULTISPECIES: cytochrome P450 [Micromonospora]|uniref:Cytochrome P450 n=1 Tax=Micromonospora antibiotica TaxID=2807623 RepID=A0ABS3VD69_9ACTN|nr:MULTISPECIES: cytochrome P450 [Micromonospora]ALA09370.1 cytochrome P450 [Micromonospora sp. RL09-050-HVF-A]MBO4163573.1 cytochrome P450 [Micromonospora antibiotica]MBW4705808.1 cytochrome P450 [Micromonospora sp. RL09-050-HVF-A]